MTPLRILCWEHRRAVEPMRAAIDAYRAEKPGTVIDLSFRPLSDFEHQGIAGAAAENDMVVFDHPFCGDIAESGVFLPLEDALADALGADSRYVGPSLATYRYGGHIWGAPIDAATQHAVTRPDLLEAAGEPVPESWGDAVALGNRLARRGLKLGMAVETPHAILTVGSLMANAGVPWGTDPGAPMTVDRDGFLAAMEWMRELLAFCPARGVGLEQHRPARGDGGARRRGLLPLRLRLRHLRRIRHAPTARLRPVRRCRGALLGRLGHRRDGAGGVARRHRARGGARLRRLHAGRRRAAPSDSRAPRSGGDERILGTIRRTMRGSTASSRPRVPRWKPPGCGRAVPATRRFSTPPEMSRRRPCAARSPTRRRPTACNRWPKDAARNRIPDPVVRPKAAARHVALTRLWTLPRLPHDY